MFVFKVNQSQLSLQVGYQWSITTLGYHNENEMMASGLETSSQYIIYA